MNGETQRNDIALIRLDEPVPIFSEEPSKSFAQPVCLPWSDYVDVNHPAIKTTGTILNLKLLYPYSSRARKFFVTLMIYLLKQPGGNRVNIGMITLSYNGSFKNYICKRRQVVQNFVFLSIFIA